MATSLLLNCFALLGLLTTATLARPLPPENSPNNFMMIITMVINNIGTTSIEGKVAPSPPSPQSSPPRGQVTASSYPAPRPDTPSPQLQLVSSSCAEWSLCDSLIHIFTDFGKTPKSPPSPRPAPSKHQGTIEQPIQQRSPPYFQFKSMSIELGKTPKSPPSPRPAPSKHQGTMEQTIQQSSSPDFQYKSMSTELRKTTNSPPSPKPSSSKHQGIIKQPIQQKSPPDFLSASF
ncbi:hypothetical protein PTKIN_Ptkin13bG0145700 [Pterospermum kingtungense]